MSEILENKTYIIREATRLRCEIQTLNAKQKARFREVSLETFHFFYKLEALDFSIYFWTGREMVEFIRPGEFCKELLDQVWEAAQKSEAGVEICIAKGDFGKYQNALESVRQRKYTELREKLPDVDEKVLQVFGNLSSASQMVVKGGIDNQVVDKVKASAAYLVSNLMDSESAISTLTRMVLCDPTLYDHSASVAMIASVIGKFVLKNPLPEKAVRIVSECGLYHDVGKTCVPQAVLNKPGKFTLEEFEVMKTHTTLGHRELLLAIERGANVHELATRIALEHHERFDGSGYPHGKKGRLEEDDSNGIHLYSRIVTIADVYSALLMKRVYKEAYDRQKTLKIMVDMAESHFDPEIFNPFVMHVAKSLHYEQHQKHEKDKGRIWLQDESGKIKVKSSA